MKKYFSSLGRSQGGHVMLSPFFHPRYSTVLNEKSNNLLPISPDMQQSITTPCILLGKWGLLDYCVTVQLSQKRKFQFHCIQFNVPGTNFSIKQLRGKNALLQFWTRSTLSYIKTHSLTGSLAETDRSPVVHAKRVSMVQHSGYGGDGLRWGRAIYPCRHSWFTHIIFIINVPGST